MIETCISYCDVLCLQVVNLVEDTPKTVSYFYYLLETFPCTADGREDDIAEDVGIKSYLRAGRFISIDSFSVTHGPFSKIFGMHPINLVLLLQ